MSKIELKEMIKVMQHYENGGEVECAEKGFDEWKIANDPSWLWYDYNYRIKEPKQKVTIEKWLMRGDTGCCFVLEGDSSYFESYQNITKVKLLDTYEGEL